MKQKIKCMYHDDIPLKFVGDNILEIGVSDVIMNSIIWPFINEKKYLGIDIKIRDKSLYDKMNIIEADVLTYEFKQKFNTILAINTFEHIHLWDWSKLVEKLKTILSQNGYIIIVVPYKQRFKQYRDFPNVLKYDRFEIHNTYGIDKKMMNYFFPGSKIALRRKFLWRQDNAGFLWSLGRFIKRTLLHRFTNKLVLRPIRKSMMVIWKKIEL